MESVNLGERENATKLEREYNESRVSLRFFRLLLLSGLALVVYYLSLELWLPGYFRPLSPFHSDFYDYTGKAEMQWLQLLQFPRPVTFLLFKCLGAWDVRPLMAAGIGIAIADVILLLLLAERMWPRTREVSWAGATLYFVLVFTHPQFYIEHRHDMPAMFSLLFLMVALHAWLSWLKHSSVSALFLCALCVFGFGFTKETFFVSVLAMAIPLLILYPAKRLETFGFLLFCLAVEVAAVLYSRSHSSPFVDTVAATASSYYIDARVSSVMHVFLLYGRYLFFGPTLFLATLAMVLARRDLLTIVSFAIAGIAALVPIAFLPNHLFSEYAWLAAPFILLPVAWLRVPSLRWRFHWQIPVLAGIAALSLLYEVRAKHIYGLAQMRWYLGQELIGGHLLASLSRADAETAGVKRILVTGVDTPFVPWTSDVYTMWRFGHNRDWFIVSSGEELTSKSSRNVLFLKAPQIDLAHIDRVLFYGATGNLERGISGDQARREAYGAIDLVPQLSRLHLGDASSMTTALDAASAASQLAHWSLYSLAIPYLARAVVLDHGSNPEELYQMGDAYARLGKATEAALSFNQALAHAATPIQSSLYRKALTDLNTRMVSGGVTSSLEINPGNPIHADGSGLAKIQLKWKVPAGTSVELHVNACDGPMMAGSDGPGSAETGKWVRDHMTFYLQDVTAGKTLTADNTLASITAEVISK